MNVITLACGYLAIGSVAAAFVLIRRRSPVDAALMLGLWPMAGPLLLSDGGAGADRRERELLVALRRAAATPLGGILPDQATGRALARRLRDAAHRVREIDALLARPDFDASAARARAADLERRGGSACAVTTAGLRAQTLDRMRQLRQRYTAELDEVGEIIAQLVTQAELVRLSGSGDDTAAELVRELVARIEGLDSLLTEPGIWSGGAPHPGGR